MRVGSLGWGDPLEEVRATHSSILAWRIPWTEEPGELHAVHMVAKSWTQLKRLNTHTHTSGLHLDGQANPCSGPTCAQMRRKSYKALRLENRRRGLPSRATAPTWVTEALVAGAHAAARAVGAGAERTEVHELPACRAREARVAAAAEVQPLSVAGPVVLAGRRGARVHLLLAGGAQVACGKMQNGGGVKRDITFRLIAEKLRLLFGTLLPCQLMNTAQPDQAGFLRFGNQGTSILVEI